jgi:hypothetical protein
MDGPCFVSNCQLPLFAQSLTALISGGELGDQGRVAFCVRVCV